MYQYTTEVFSVGLEGLAPVDDERLGEMAADGWEPTLMTPVHNGFATLVLFRREGAAGLVRRPKAAAAAAPARGKAAAASKAAAKTPLAKAAPGRSPLAPAAAPAPGRVRRPRPTS